MITSFQPDWMEAQTGSIWRNWDDRMFKKGGPEGTLVVILSIKVVGHQQIMIDISPYGADRQYSEATVTVSSDYLLRHYKPTGRRSWINDSRL